MLRRINGVHEKQHDARTQAAIDAGHPEWAELPTLSNGGQTRYFTGLSCKHGHVFPRQRQGICEECNRIKSREAQARLRRDDPERVKAYGKTYAENHDLNAKARDYYHRTRDARMEWERKWRAENADKVKAYDRKSRRKNAPQKLEYDRKWRDENRGRYRACQRHRQALKAQATPPWMTERRADRGR